MREVTPFIWQLWCGEMPMPEGATDEMMWAAKEALDGIEMRDDAVKGIEYHTESLAHYEKKLEVARSNNEPTQTLESIIKTTNEIIETYRSWLE